MSKQIQYTDEPIGEIRLVADFCLRLASAYSGNHKKCSGVTGICGCRKPPDSHAPAWEPVVFNKVRNMSYQEQFNYQAEGMRQLPEGDSWQQKHH